MKKEQSKGGEITIGFNDQTAHSDIIQQVVDKLWLAGFASKEEIIDNLKMADILYKNSSKKKKRNS